MKNLFVVLSLLLLTSFSAFGQSVFELDGSQSMSITGKGAGQDAAINPYLTDDSVAVVENIGKNDFVIRIQSKGKLVKRVTIAPNQVKEVAILKGYELYFDSELKATAQVSFKKLDN